MWTNELGIVQKAALDNAHETMIRAEKNLFVKNKLIRFDVDGIDYLDVQAAVVAQEHITLEQSVVENFLIEQGYRKMRVSGVTDKIIEKARSLRRHV